MATNVTIPSLGESVSEAVLIRWLKNDGDVVKTDESLAELETDKANVDLPSPAAGTLRTGAKAGETVKIGDSVATIEEGGAGAAPSSKPAAAPAPIAKAEAPKPAAAAPAAVAAPATAPARSGTAPEDLSPAVRRVVAETQIDPAAVTPTGPGGRITKQDAVSYAETSGSAANAAPAPAAAAPHKAPASVTAPKPLAAAPEGDTGYDADGAKRVPMSKIRKRIAQSLVQAQQTAAILTTFNEIDMSAVIGLRTKYKERFQEIHGVGLGFMSFFARAVSLALKEFPRVNARIDGDDIVYHNHVHLGIAVSTERGLMVPVLRHVEQLSFASIESEIKRLALAARDGKVAIHELTGGTFTVTNGGVFGSLLSTPIINPPQSGILGMHAIVKRPIAVGDKVEIRPMMYVALSYDHRIVDGRESVSFLVRLKEFLEDPTRLILEI